MKIYDWTPKPMKSDSYYESRRKKAEARSHLEYKVLPEFFRWFEKIFWFGHHGR